MLCNVISQKNKNRFELQELRSEYDISLILKSSDNVCWQNSILSIYFFKHEIQIPCAKIKRINIIIVIEHRVYKDIKCRLLSNMNICCGSMSNQISVISVHLNPPSNTHSRANSMKQDPKSFL